MQDKEYLDEIRRISKIENRDEIQEQLSELGEKMGKKGFLTLTSTLSTNVLFEPLSGNFVGDNDIDMTAIWFQRKDFNILFSLAKQVPKGAAYQVINLYLGDKKIEEVSALWLLYKKKYFYYLDGNYYNGKTIVKVNGKEITLDDLLIIKIKFNGIKKKLFNPFFQRPFSGNEGFIYHNNEILKLYKFYDINIGKYKWNVVENCSNFCESYFCIKNGMR